MIHDDRAILELAARAAGLKIDKSPYNGGGAGNTGFDSAGNAVLDWHNGKSWNPLTDDGDALRLAVKLGIDLYVRVGIGSRATYHEMSVLVLCEDEPDQNAATRRAIVRVAAEIGEML